MSMRRSQHATVDERATRRKPWLWLAAGLILPLWGCVMRPQRPRIIPGASSAPVYLSRGHIHSRSCGHYYHDGHWFYLRGHVHGPNCGHVFVNRNWRRESPRSERIRGYPHPRKGQSNR